MAQKLNNHNDMKKKYLAPEMENVKMTAKTVILILSNGENLSSNTYGQREVEEDDVVDFWN